MIITFRIISYLEGISYLLLLFIGVPLKYFGGNEILVKTLGMPHGILFIAYILMAFFIKPEFKWNNRDFMLILLASVIPFGTFIADWKFLTKKEKVKSE